MDSLLDSCAASSHEFFKTCSTLRQESIGKDFEVDSITQAPNQP